MVQKIQGAQRDFSFGEVDVALKRSDEHPARKAGLRQMTNARILNSGAVQNRSGRRALYPITFAASRTESITMQSGSNFHIQFAPGRVQIVNFATGVNLASFAALPWASKADINSIVYAIFNLNIYVTFGHAMRPKVITWDGVATWTIADYNEAVSTGGQKQTPFYRLSPQNVTMLPSNVTGAITVLFSSPIAAAGMVGTRMRYCGRQILITAFNSTSSLAALVIEPLPPSELLALTGSIGNFAVGDLVEGSITGAQGIVTQSPTMQYANISVTGGAFAVGSAITGATSGATGVITSIAQSVGLGIFNIAIALTSATAFAALEGITAPGGNSATTNSVTGISMVVQLIQNSTSTLNFFEVGEIVAGLSGSGTISTVTHGGPQAVSVWDDEIMNTLRGFPASCFTDQFRVGFCDFPALPGGIAWSAINTATDLFANDASSPDNSIFEIAPNKVRVQHVVPGPEGSEFIFCDTKLYYIPISPTNPLKPGSVQFMLLSGDGCAQVQPRIAQEAVLYVNAGQNSMMAVIATGAYNRPFNTKNLSNFHQHLFNAIQCIAAPSADGTFNERYAYVLNGDGSIACGKYDPDSLQTAQPVIGWGPWSGASAVSWIGARASDVVFTSSYFGAGMVEVLDDTQYLDGALKVNALPAAFAAPAGKGPLWFYAAQSVWLMDQVTRTLGTYQVDANGNIVPQFNGGENLAAASLVAGQSWTMTTEPFCPDANPGTDVGQRMFRRRVSRLAAYVENSTGFLMARLFSGPITPTSPPLGTVMNFHRVPAWNMGDDVTKPPPLREIAERMRPIGRSFDPRVAIIKDSPGPLLIAELGLEATI